MIAVDGGEVWTDDSGGDGPPLVLLHPGIGDSRIWEPVLPALAASYRVIRYDARGFGRSPAPTAKFSLLADLISVLGYYGLDRAAFVGCSQGGGSALGLTLEQPARVSALVLLCPGIPGYPWPEEPDELDAEYERALDAGDVDALADLLQRIWAGAGPPRRSWNSCVRGLGPRFHPVTCSRRIRRSTAGLARSRCRRRSWSATRTIRR